MTFARTKKVKTAARGYGGTHQKLRAALLPKAYGTPCTRCREPLLPGQELHFDHNDIRTGYLGFAHADCNRKAGARKGNRVSKARRMVRTGRDDSARW